MNSDDQRSWHGTTILAVRKNGQVVIAGDGQVTLGNTIVKANARKVRRIGDDDDARLEAVVDEGAHEVGLGPTLGVELNEQTTGALDDEQIDVAATSERCHLPGVIGDGRDARPGNARCRSRRERVWESDELVRLEFSGAGVNRTFPCVDLTGDSTDETLHLVGVAAVLAGLQTGLRRLDVDDSRTGRAGRRDDRGGGDGLAGVRVGPRDAEHSCRHEPMISRSTVSAGARSASL